MTLSLILTRCSGLSRRADQCGLQLLDLLKNAGVVFLPFSCSPEIEPHPEKKVATSGRISDFIGVEHQLLSRSLGHDASGRPRFHGSADMTFTGPDGSISIDQVEDRRAPESWPILADSLWRFAAMFLPHLKPDYAHLDLLGRGSWTDVWKLELRYLFWRNVFGKRYVDKYGREFFLGAPGECIERDDGSIEYCPEPRFLDWVSTPSQKAVDAVKYFQQKIPKIEGYHA